MATIVVTYPRHDGAEFDAGYYANVHIPLVEEHWGPAGMTRAEILFPVDDSQPYAAMVLLRFSSQGAIDAALTSPGTPEVMADVAKFTNIQPNVMRAAD